MPIIEKEIVEVHPNIVRPVALGVMRHVMKLTGVPQSTPIQYLGDSGAALIEGSTVEGSTEPTRFTASNKVFIEVTDELLPEDNLTRFTNQGEQPPIFLDSKLKLRLHPVVGKARQTISVRFRGEDKGTAERWLRGMTRKISHGMRYHSHELEFHYLVPREAIAVIVEVYNKREAKHGYGQTLPEYIREHMTKRACTMTNAAGTQGRLAIRERQIGVLGAFEFEDAPREEKDATGATYVASIDYVVDYDRPISVVTRYPASVHSQMIGREFWPKEPVPYTKDYPQVQTARSLSAYATIVNQMQPNRHTPSVEGYRYPVIDDWYPPRRYPGSRWAARFLTVPKESVVLRLETLGEVSLNPAALKYLKKWPQYATIPSESPVYVKVYEDDEELDVSEFYLNKELQVVLRYEPDLRKVYHCTIGLVYDLKTLSPGAVDRVTKDPDLVEVITGKKPDTDSGGNVTPPWWDHETRPGKEPDLERRTVGHYFIITHRQEELS